MAEYVSLTMRDFEDIFKSLGAEASLFDKPGVKEYLFKVKTKHPIISVVVYSSLDKSNQKTRGVGEDAIRLVFWHDKEDHPIGKGKRIYRVTSKESVAARIGKTIKDFLAQAPNISIIDWDYVKAVLKNTIREGFSNGFAQSLLESLEKYKRLTEGQLVYVIGELTPKGKRTMEAQLKWKGWIYDPQFEDLLEEAESKEKAKPAEPIEESPEDLPRTKTSQKKYDIPVVSDTPEMELAPTAGYPYKFEKFNPIQTLTFPYRNEDTNVVIGAATSSGKTICAEILMDECLRRDKW